MSSAIDGTAVSVMADEARQAEAPARKKQRQQYPAGPGGAIAPLPYQQKGGSKLAVNKRRRAPKAVAAEPHIVEEGAAVVALLEKKAPQKRAPLHAVQRHKHTGAMATGLGAQAATSPGRIAKGWAGCCWW